MIVCDTAVVFVPAKTPVKLEATDDGLDVWVAAVNPQVFQGEHCPCKVAVPGLVVELQLGVMSSASLPLCVQCAGIGAC